MRLEKCELNEKGGDGMSRPLNTEKSPAAVRRGYHPDDGRFFGPGDRDKMTRGAAEIRYLLDRGYRAETAVPFVGNHHLLSERQRTALMRMTASSAETASRRDRELCELSGTVLIDGFNTIITLEVALSGSVVIAGDDGAIRDLAGLHGTYRLVDKTTVAVDLILKALATWPIDGARFLLDRPVSNSGRLKTLIRERAAGQPYPVEVELLPSPDAALYGQSPVISSDSGVLDRCGGWFNLNRRIIEENIPGAFVYRV